MTQTQQIPGKSVKQYGYEFILSLQSAIDTDKLWDIYLEKITEELSAASISLEESRLVYKAGILFNSTTIVKKDKKQEEELSDFPFLPPTTAKHEFKNKKLKFIHRQETYLLQVELTFDKNPKEDKLIKDILVYTRILLNRLFLLLKLENYAYHAIKDDITLAYNQNYLREFLHHEIERCKRYPPSFFSIVFFDLDNLKAVNENHGHLVGTEVLKEVAAILREDVRETDLLSRFGGDEFVIVLLRTDAQAAYNTCERIKVKLAKYVFLEEEQLNIKMTGCFGIASFPQDGDSVDVLIRKSDAAMYDVKHTGKDGIKIYEGD
ncbi:MAG: GGDEF domain-containing protein [bacterium]|nr:GGDEF domain-containing protein [bacterium]